jgi:hypothetical protein
VSQPPPTRASSFESIVSSDAAYRRVSTFLQQLEAEGVQTSFTLSPPRRRPTRPASGCKRRQRRAVNTARGDFPTLPYGRISESRVAR